MGDNSSIQLRRCLLFVQYEYCGNVVVSQWSQSISYIIYIHTIEIGDYPLLLIQHVALSNVKIRLQY